MAKFGQRSEFDLTLGRQSFAKPKKRELNMMRLDSLDEGRRQKSFIRLFVLCLLVLLPLLIPLLLLGVWEWWVTSLLPEPSLWGRWIQFWWLPSILLCLAVLGGLVVNFLFYYLDPNLPYFNRRLTRSAWQSAEGLVQSHLHEGEQTLAAVRITLPAPLHPLFHSPIFGMLEFAPYLIALPQIFAFIFASGIGGELMGAPLSHQWQLTIMTLLALVTLTIISIKPTFETWVGSLSVVLMGTFLIRSKFLSPQFETALIGVFTFNTVLLFAQPLVLLKFPIKGLLVITTERVMLLGRIPRRWLMLRTVEKNLPVRILMTFRTIDVLMRWRTGTDTFIIAVDLHNATELKTFLSEHFPHWQWEGDSVMPAWRQRFQREGLWRLALLLTLMAWTGWIWHQSNLRIKVLSLPMDISKMTQDERKYHLQQLELALKLLPNEPLVRTIYANALFAIGEWERTAQEMQHLLPTDLWRLMKRLMSIEKRWQKEVAEKFDESDWRFDVAMAERFVALILKRGEVANFFAYRAIVWLKRSIQEGAPEEVSDAVEFLETAVAKHELGLLKKAQNRIQLALRK